MFAAVSVLSVAVATEPVGASYSAGGGALELTGYRTISPETTAGPVTAMVNGRDEAAIKAALTGLSVSPPSGCVEVLPGFSMSFITGADTDTKAVWTWDECPTPGVVREVVGGKAVGTYKFDCALHSAVLGAIPKRAVATRRDLQRTRCS